MNEKTTKWLAGRPAWRFQTLKPVVPAWVNKDPITDDTRYWPTEPDPEMFNGLSDEDLQYIIDLEKDARKLQGLALFLGGLLVLFTVVACIMYQAGWIIH